jgi:hypothetical protein
MTQWNSDQIKRAALSPRWAVLSQTGGVAADLINYDRFLIREPRLLVPIDVQALVVRVGANDTTTMLRLPFRTDDEAFPPLDITNQGSARPAGVHLLWSVPAALGKGTIVPDPAAPDDVQRRRLDLPMLPDRWAVVRLAVPAGASDPVVTGWVLEADSGTATPLTEWPQGTPASLASAIPAAQLNVHVGGLGWHQCYDSALGRCAFYDDLSDLKGMQLEGDAISYLVAGWWSHSADDPLDGVGSDVGYRQRLSDLGWNDPDHPSTDDSQRAQSDDRYRVAKAFGLPMTQRYTQSVVLAAGKGTNVSTTNAYVAPSARALHPTVSGFLTEAVSAAALQPAPSHSTLVHGRIHGVPLASPIAPDSQPNPAAMRVVLGSSTPDVAAAVTVAGAGMGIADQDARRAAERILAAFSAGLLVTIADSNTWADIDEYEHAHGFQSLPGGIEATDRFVDKPGTVADPGSGFRPGGVPAAQLVKKAAVTPQATVLWSAVARPDVVKHAEAFQGIREISQFDGRVRAVPPTPPTTVREVPRPAPPYRQPAAQVLGVTGGGRALSAVEVEEADGKLMCRLSDQTSQGHTGLLGSDELLTTLGTSAVPDEVLDLAREALSEDPYLTAWRTRRTAAKGFDPEAANTRFTAEAAVAHAYYSADNARLATYLASPVASSAERQKATEGLLRLSLSEGVWSHPEGVTMWGQPWRPMFCDWQVSIDLAPTDPFVLNTTDLDLSANSGLAPTATVTFQGRSALVPGVAKTLAAGIDRWLTEERQRDLGGHGLADPATEASLASLRESLAQVDMLSVALDGVREQLLGLEYDRGVVYADGNALPDGTRRSMVHALPQLLACGRLTLAAARLVDAFGRHVDLPVDQLIVPERLVEPNTRDLLVRPRITAPARWRFDLVDATSTSTDAPLARIDQADPGKQVNPIAGFLLPDHMDDSLEFFATDGMPLGELLHDAYSDAVTWEIAPGRSDVAPAAGPTDDPDPTRHVVGWVAAGVVASDAADRKGTPNRSETESSLSALLRAIDTTLWTVDPFGSLGTEHIAGLVGRPIAVVAARLSLDIKADLDDHVYTSDDLLTARQAAFEAMAAQVFEVRLGEITRSDDGLLGYFVDDDYSTFHVVDRVIAERALPSGRGQGVLDPANTDPLAPEPITHPFINADGVVRIRPGQTMRLTLLMHPGGKVHLSSGILPRIDKALARDWVNPGLSVLAPSLRSGPLLIDADKVRLPKVASFPADQLFTHRDTPTSWKDDPILAATQSALLPDTQPQVQEGWVRIDPNPPGSGSGSGSGNGQGGA